MNKWRTREGAYLVLPINAAYLGLLRWQSIISQRETQSTMALSSAKTAPLLVIFQVVVLLVISAVIMSCHICYGDTFGANGL
jgi:uncharacterized membrane protein YidH (DUF202 family)